MGFLFAVGTTRRDFIPTDAQQFHSRWGHLAGSYLLTRALVTEGTSPRILCHELTFLPIRATQVAPGGAGEHDGSDGCGCSALPRGICHSPAQAQPEPLPSYTFYVHSYRFRGV